MYTYCVLKDDDFPKDWIKVFMWFEVRNGVIVDGINKYVILKVVDYGALNEYTMGDNRRLETFIMWVESILYLPKINNEIMAFPLNIFFCFKYVFSWLCALMSTRHEIMFLWRLKLTRSQIICFNFFIYACIISENINENGVPFRAYFVILYTKWTHFANKTILWAEKIFEENGVPSARKRPKR